MAALYLLVSHDRTLLYVGRTVDLPRRMYEHGRQKPWEQVATIHLIHLPADEVADWEAETIEALRPLWNIAGYAGETCCDEARRSFILADRVCASCGTDHRGLFRGHDGETRWSWLCAGVGLR